MTNRVIEWIRYLTGPQGIDFGLRTASGVRYEHVAFVKREPFYCIHQLKPFFWCSDFLAYFRSFQIQSLPSGSAGGIPNHARESGTGCSDRCFGYFFSSYRYQFSVYCGSVNQKVEPRPFSLTTPIVPPCRRII